jgi:hypothetical protein
MDKEGISPEDKALTLHARVFPALPELTLHTR